MHSAAIPGRFAAFALLATMAMASACGEVSQPASPEPSPEGQTTEPALRPEAGLTHTCYSWPQVEFDRDHHSDLKASVSQGEQAIDFTLHDPDGNPHTLNGLLRERPVLLVLGGYT